MRSQNASAGCRRTCSPTSSARSPSAGPPASTSSASASATPTCPRRRTSSRRWRRAPPTRRRTSTRATRASSASARRWPGSTRRASASSSTRPTEIVPLLGAKEGIAHICLVLLDPGDVALAADPGYPVYITGPMLADGVRGAPAAGARARLPAGPRGHPGGALAKAHDDLRQLPEQPDGRRHRGRLLRPSRRLRAAPTTSSWSTTTPTPTSPTTATWRRASSRRRAPRRSASRCSASRRATT